MKVELLYFAGCPTYELALSRLQEALRESGVDVPVEMIEVNSVEQAQALRFLGSPSIRINRLDVERTARERTSYGLTCRMYRTESGLEGSPSVELIRTAISEALKAERKA